MPKIRRSTTLLCLGLSVALLAGCMSQKVEREGASVSFEVAGEGSINPDATAESPRAVIARTRAEVYDIVGEGRAALWLDRFPFQSSAVVLVLGGARPNGGYTVQVTRLARSGDELVAVGAVQPPSPDVMTTQAFAEPYQALTVPLSELTGVTKARAELSG